VTPAFKNSVKANRRDGLGSKIWNFFGLGIHTVNLLSVIILIKIGILNRWKMPENTTWSAKIKRSGFLPASESAAFPGGDAKNRCA